MAEPDRGVLLNYPEQVVSPNDFRNLAELEQTLLAFIDRYNTTARPFNWKFTAADLTRLLARIRPTKMPPTSPPAFRGLPDQPPEELPVPPT